MPKTRCIAVLTVLFVCTAPGVWAQTMPDAGALMRQTEQALRFDQMQRNAQRRESLPPAMVFDDATRVTAARIKFVGAKRLSDDLLQTAAKPYLDRPLTQHDLQRLTEAIADAYRQAGWLVQVYIPRQDLATPELTLQVIESIPPSKPIR